MGTVSVSREALQKIKIELGNFQTSMDSSTEHMKAHAEEVVVGVRNSIKKQQSLVAALEKTAAKLAGEIEQRQAQIINNNNKLNTLASNIAAGKAQSSGMDQRISQLQSRKQQLISLGSANSDNGGNDNSGQINAIENQIRECDNQRRRLNEQIASMQSQQNELNRQNDQLRDEKIRKEAELSTAKGELNKAREKNEKMKSAGAMVESKTGDLLGVVQHFKQTVTTTSSTSKSGIEKCISAINEYEAVNLSQGHVSAGTAFSSYEQRRNRTPKDITRWVSGVRGEGLCTSSDDEVNSVLASYGLSGVTYHNAIPDFSPFAVYTVEIGNMQGGTQGRDNRNTEYGGVVGNFSQADRALAEQLGITIQEAENLRESHVPALTWHERNDTHTTDLIPTIINGSFGHYGGTAEAEAIRRESHSADDLLDSTSDNISNAMDYSDNQEIYNASMEETPPVSNGPIDRRF